MLCQIKTTVARSSQSKTMQQLDPVTALFICVGNLKKKVICSVVCLSVCFYLVLNCVRFFLGRVTTHTYWNESEWQPHLPLQSRWSLTSLLRYSLVSQYMFQCKAQQRRRLGKKRRPKDSPIVSQLQEATMFNSSTPFSQNITLGKNSMLQSITTMSVKYRYLPQSK